MKISDPELKISANTDGQAESTTSSEFVFDYEKLF